MSDGRNLCVHMLHRSTGLIEDPQNGGDRKSGASVLERFHQGASGAQVGEQQIFGHSVGRFRVVDKRRSDIFYDVRVARELFQQTYFLDYVLVGVSVGGHQSFQGIFGARCRILGDEYESESACEGYTFVT